MKKFAMFILCLSLLAACGGSDNNLSRYKVNYSINNFCCAQGDIIYQSEYGKKTIQNIPLPVSNNWRYEFLAQKGDYIYLELSNLKRLPSNEICENQNILFAAQIYIFINDKVFKHISCYADNDAPSSIDNCDALILEGIVP